MKKLLTLAVATAMTLSVAAASATTLKLSEVHAEGYPTTLADQEFARLIEERTEGRIKVEVYSGGQLYGEETGAIEALQLGDIAFARVSASPVASYVPALNAIQMPYLYKNARPHVGGARRQNRPGHAGADRVLRFRPRRPVLV